MPLKNKARFPAWCEVFALGGLSSLAMAPLNLWPVLFIAFSRFYILLNRSASAKSAALLGFMFGLGYFGFGLYWIGNALLVEGNPYRWAWPLAVSGLPLMLAPFFAASCGLSKLLFKLDSLRGFLFFVCVFTLFEWLRGHIFTGFPWNLFGYTWAAIPEIAQLASLHDIYVLTLITVFWIGAGGFLYATTMPTPLKIISAIGVVVTLIAGYSFGSVKLGITYAQTDKPKIDIVLIQPNIPQNEKWDPEIVVKNFMRMVQSSAHTEGTIDPNIKATYIIWPETAISTVILNAAWSRTAIAQTLATYPGRAYLITGAQRYIPEKDQYFNSIIVFDKNGTILYIYDKSHLVPFGEYMPLSDFIDIAPIVGFKGFESGSGPTTLTMPEGVSFSPLICYEVIFPGKTIKAENPPDFMVNITNDAWYGISPGPYQHLVQAQFRAIETGLPLLRIANTGFTAAIDRHGRVTHETALFKNDILRLSLPY